MPKAIVFASGVLFRNEVESTPETKTIVESPQLDLLTLEEALAKLEAMDRRKAEVF